MTKHQRHGIITTARHDHLLAPSHNLHFSVLQSSIHTKPGSDWNCLQLQNQKPGGCHGDRLGAKGKANVMLICWMLGNNPNALSLTVCTHRLIYTLTLHCTPTFQTFRYRWVHREQENQCSVVMF